MPRNDPTNLSKEGKSYNIKVGDIDSMNTVNTVR